MANCRSDDSAVAVMNMAEHLRFAADRLEKIARADYEPASRRRAAHDVVRALVSLLQVSVVH